MKLKNLLEKLTPGLTNMEIIETCDGETANVLSYPIEPQDLIRVLSYNVIAIGVLSDSKLQIIIKK